MVRYVSATEGQVQVREEPIAMLDLISDIRSTTANESHSEVKLSGQAIGATLFRVIENLGLPLDRLVGQGYDGAAAMSSERVGVSSIIQASAPLADYFHCCMHALNLSGLQSTNVVAVRHCMNEIKEMVSFFKYAKRNSHLVKVIKQNQGSDEDAMIQTTKRQHLVSLCQTRFVERHEAVFVARQLLPSVVTAFEDMVMWNSLETRKNARRLLNSIQTAEFLITLIIWEQVSSLLRPVSRCLQAVGNDLISAVSTIQALQSKLQVLRDDRDNEFQVLFEDARVLAAEVGVTPEEMSCVPRAPRSVYRLNAGAADQDSSAYYRINVYFPMLDSILQDLKARFSPHHQKVAGLSSLVPSFISKSVWSDVVPAFNKYAVFLDSIDVVKVSVLCLLVGMVCGSVCIPSC